MLTLARQTARMPHAWLAVGCDTCNATIGEACNPAVFGPGPHRSRVEYAQLLGFRETDQRSLDLDRTRA